MLLNSAGNEKPGLLMSADSNKSRMSGDVQMAIDNLTGSGHSVFNTG